MVASGRRCVLVLDPGEGTFAPYLPVDSTEIKRIIEMVSLNLALAVDIYVMDHEEFIIDSGRLEKSHPRRGPDTGST